MTGTEEHPMVWLERWYQAQCSGDWEHQYGVRIGTLDNPGWSLDVDLVHTAAAGRTKEPRIVERSETDWIFCEVKDGVFRARGGPGNLVELLGAFREFVGEKNEYLKGSP